VNLALVKILTKIKIRFDRPGGECVHVKEKKESCEKNPAQLHVVAIVEPHQSNGQTKPIRKDFSLEIIQPKNIFYEKVLSFTYLMQKLMKNS
jgi:hypothetical protein